MNGNAEQEQQPEAGHIVDSARMQDLVSSLGEALQDVVDSYLEESPRMITEMERACQRGDWEDLERLAHSLKSSSGIFGARRMVNLSRALELSARGNETGSLEAVQEIAVAFEEVRAVLNLYLKTL